MDFSNMFKIAIDLFKSQDKTKSNKKKMKDIVLKFDIAYSNNELGGNLEQIKKLKHEIDLIRREL